MTIVFVGDLALPSGISPQVEDGFPSFDEPVVANLEGPIASRAPKEGRVSGLWSSAAEILPFLRTCGIVAVSLANNHIQDFGDAPRLTKIQLQSAGIASFGAGATVEEAIAPEVVEVGDQRFALLGFGWEVIGCRSARGKRPGVSPLRPQHVLSSVSTTLKGNPDTYVVAIMHWNYEGEAFPQPMHRQLAFAAIDAGASAVIGCHPHCVQGVEVYRGCPIVYSLGNWFLPSGVFWGGTLVYPAATRLELAFEWDPRTGGMRCHWYEYDSFRHTLEFLGVESLDQSTAMEYLTPFRGMNHKEYCRWFSINRRKKIALPVYENKDHNFENWIKDRWVRGRQQGIGLLRGLGLKQGPR